jgi:TolA-binding protein
MFTTQATLERRAAKEHRLAGIEERLIAMAGDLDSLKHFRTATEGRLDTIEKRGTAVESTVSSSVTQLKDSLASAEGKITERNDTVSHLSDSNRNLTRQVQEINSRIDDVLQRMIELKADIDKVATAAVPPPPQTVTGNSSFKSSGGASKFAGSSKKTSAVTDDN